MKLVSQMVLALLLSACARHEITCEEHPNLIAEKLTDKNSKSISVSEVVNNQDDYVGKRVTITGEVSLDFESIVVSDKEFSIWLDLTEEQVKYLRKPTYLYRRVTGIYSKKGGHLFCCKGSLSEIENVQ